MTGEVVYSALVLAAGRGPDDPMAKTFGIAHKCLVPVAGKPMLARVVNALKASRNIGTITICIDDPSVIADALDCSDTVQVTASASSAPASVLASINQAELSWPVLVTTADHALLTHEMVNQFLAESQEQNADLTVGLAAQAVIEKAIPDTSRTYLSFADTRVSGCNLFTLQSAKSLQVVQFWEQADKNRKQPWKLVRAFGIWPLVRWLFGSLTLDNAFSIASQRLGATVKPIIMPFAEAAVDVDKPEDKYLADRLLKKRR